MAAHKTTHNHNAPLPGKWGGCRILTHAELETEKIVLELDLKSPDPEVRERAERTMERREVGRRVIAKILPVYEERIAEIDASLKAAGIS